MTAPTSNLPTLYDAMCRSIEEVHAIDQVKDIRNKAKALEDYSKQAMNFTAERQCAEIRSRAERRCGELLADRAMARGGGDQRSDHRSQIVRGDQPQTLADLGITHRQSSEWQQLAQVPRATFERAMTEPGRLTAGAIIARHEAETRPPGADINAVHDDALWLWGQIKDFERDGILEKDPNDVLVTMMDHMRETTLRLAPVVAAWLGRIRG